MTTPPRTLLHNARIYPGRRSTDEHWPIAERGWLLTQGADIVSMAGEADYEATLLGMDEARGDEVIDCQGALLTPAFCDAHVHLTMTGQGLDGIDLSATESVGEALRLIESAARHTRGRPIYAHSWDERQWVEHRPVTARELDRATYGGVVYMPRIDAHSASVSSAMAAVARVEGLDGWDGNGVVTRAAFAAVSNAFTSAMTPRRSRTLPGSGPAGSGRTRDRPDPRDRCRASDFLR